MASSTRYMSWLIENEISSSPSGIKRTVIHHFLHKMKLTEKKQIINEWRERCTCESEPSSKKAYQSLLDLVSNFDGFKDFTGSSSNERQKNEEKILLLFQNISIYLDRGAAFKIELVYKIKILLVNEKKRKVWRT